MSGDKQPLYFFVCGAPKSGTTWLQKMLDSHPEIICSGEGHFVEKIAAPMAQLARDYNNQMRLVAERVYEGRPYYGLLGREDILAFARNMIVQLMGRRTKEGAWIVGDKTPRYTSFLYELKALFPDARFIHIIRDPRDVSVSRLHHALRVGYRDALKSGSEVRTKLITNSSNAWVLAQDSFDRFHRDHADQCLEVRYEDMSSHTEETLAANLRFLGAETSVALVGRIASGNSFETLSGRRPGQEDKRSFFRKGIPGDWRTALDRSEARHISELCGAWMQKKGYDVALGDHHAS